LQSLLGEKKIENSWRLKTKTFPVFAAICLLVMPSFYTVNLARAEHAGAPDDYYPFGAYDLGILGTQRTKGILYSYFLDETAELNALQLGQIDHADTPVNLAGFPTLCGGFGGPGVPGFKCSRVAGQFEALGIQLNLIRNGALPNGQTATGCDQYGSSPALSDQCLYWGINFNFGLPQSGQTINAGAEIRMAITCLLDKSGFIGGAPDKVLDDMIPPSKLAATAPSICNSVADPAQTPAVNTPDWLNALTHLARAFSQPKDPSSVDTRTAVTDLNGDGVIDFHDIDPNGDGIVDVPFRPSTQVAFFINVGEPSLSSLGTTLANAVDQIMGTTAIDREFQSIGVAARQVFSTQPPDDWQMYTFNYRFPGPNWDYYNSLYNSNYASNICIPTATVRDVTDNYEFHCDPSLDGTVSTGACPAAPSLTNIQFPPDATLSCSIASVNPMVQAVEGTQAADIPVYARTTQYAWSANWAGMVETQGVGPTDRPTFLTDYDQTGASNTLRWGQEHPTVGLNPWVAAFSSRVLPERSDYYLAQGYYDTLLSANPYNVAQLTNWAANTYSSLLAPTAAQLGYTPPAGTAQTLRFGLRSDVKWHDGVPFTANDIRFTMKECKRLGSFACFSVVSQLLDVTILGPFRFDVHMSAASPFHLFNLGSMFMLPQHIWDTDNDGLVDPGKLSSLYDPIASLVYPTGTIINTQVCTNITPVTCTTLPPTTLRTDTYAAVGYGAYVCDQRTATPSPSNPAGISAIGGLCTSSGSGNIPAGGRALLHTFDSDFSTLQGSSGNQYFRSTNKFKQWNWADVNNDLVVDIKDFSVFSINAFDCRSSRSYSTPIGTFIIARTCEKPTVAVSMTSPGATGAGTWDFGDGEPVAYDSNNNGLVDSGERSPSSTTPATGATLKTDTLLKYIDVNGNNAWDYNANSAAIPSEPVVYDSNNDNLYSAGEPIISNGASPIVITPGATLKTDPLFKYVDSNGNNVWTADTLFVAGPGTVAHTYAVAAPGTPTPTAFVVRFTPATPGAVTTTITGIGNGRVRIASWSTTSVLPGAPTETDWTYWDRFGSGTGVGGFYQVDQSDFGVFIPQFRNVWVTEAGNIPPATPIGEWNQITGIVPFNQVYGLFPP